MTVKALLLVPVSIGNIVMIAACVLAVVAFLYGVLKKFSRMSWLGWQTAVLFAATLLCGVLPEDGNEMLAFFVAAAVLVGVIALVFFLGALLRKPFLALEVGGTGGRVFNRLLGGLTAVFNIVVFFAVFGGLALFSLQNAGLEFLNVVYQIPLWSQFFGAHALDLFLVFCFALALRWGYRLGFLRVVVTLTVIGLTFLAAFLAMYMTLHVPFLAQFSQWIAGKLNMNAIAASWVGFGIVAFITAFVLMLVVSLIAFLLNLLLKLGGKSRAFGAFDGTLFALITCAVMLVVVCGFNFGVSFLANGDLSSVAGGAGESVSGMVAGMQGFMSEVEKLIVTNPLSNIFYSFNPLRLLIGS